MAEFKFNIGDKVILNCPESPEYNGQVCTIRGMEHGFGDLNFYCFREYVGTFFEDELIPYVQEPYEKLVSSMDLSQLFKEGL